MGSTIIIHMINGQYILIALAAPATRSFAVRQHIDHCIL
jgi:hypothetical protein